MRGWMRFISTTPEFTWSGTGFILAVSAVAGLGLGLVEAARRSGRRRTWRLAGLMGIGVFSNVGLFMAPTVLLGGLALAGRFHPAVRIIAALLAIAPVVLLLLNVGPVPHSLAVSVGMFLWLVGVEALAFSVLFRRWASRAATLPPETSP